MNKFTQELTTTAPQAPELLELDDLAPEGIAAMTDLRMGMDLNDVTEPVHSMSLITLTELEYSGVDDIADPDIRREAQERRRVAMLCAEAATALLATEASENATSA